MPFSATRHNSRVHSICKIRSSTVWNNCVLLIIVKCTTALWAFLHIYTTCLCLAPGLSKAIINCCPIKVSTKKLIVLHVNLTATFSAVLSYSRHRLRLLRKNVSITYFPINILLSPDMKSDSKGGFTNWRVQFKRSWLVHAGRTSEAVVALKEIKCRYKNIDCLQVISFRPKLFG